MSSVAHVTGRLGACHNTRVVAGASKPTIVGLGAEYFLRRRPVGDSQRQDLPLSASAHFATGLESRGRSNLVAPGFHRAPSAYAHTRSNSKSNSDTGANSDTNADANADARSQSHTRTQSGR